MTDPPSGCTPHPTHSPNSRHVFAIPQVFVESIVHDNFASLLRRQSCAHDRMLAAPLCSAEVDDVTQEIKKQANMVLASRIEIKSILVFN